jgi:hypothetical protein
MEKKCKYHYGKIFECKEKPFPGSDYCILHYRFPENLKYEDFIRISNLKNQKLKEKIKNKDYELFGSIIDSPNFNDIVDKDQVLWLNDSRITGDAKFRNMDVFAIILDDSIFFGNALFDNTCCIAGPTAFYGQFKGEVSFKDVKFGTLASFSNATFYNNVFFVGATFKESAEFIFTKFKKIASFYQTTFEEEISIKGSIFESTAYFANTKINGEFNAHDIQCKFLSDQERIYRLGKKKATENGDLIERDYYYFKEMESKRLQYRFIRKFTEFFFVQLIFGYGVRPQRIIITWLIVVTSFSCLFQNLEIITTNSPTFFDYFNFSLITSISPGYNGNITLRGFALGLSNLETIIGTFLWACLITTFARKFMS